MLNKLKRVWELPPKETLRKVKRILTGKGGTLDMEEIANSPRLMRAQRFYDFFSRYEAILARTCDWQPIDFEGKRVLEIGCGPQLGFGPLCIQRGAESFSSMDPEYDPDILETPSMVDGYFLNVYKDLSAVYGPRKDFPGFMDDLRTRTNIVADYLVGTRLKGPFDIVLSNSCLEHVFEFEQSMKALHQLCAPDVRYLHLVDFSNHRGTKNPFDKMYDSVPDDYLKRFDDAINLLRPSDVLRAMNAAGFDAAISPYGSFPELHSGTVHPYWSDLYGRDDLFLQTAIIHNDVAEKA
jgi:SAM-dependent methyltransferase